MQWHDEVAVLLGYAAGSFFICFQKFWDNVLVTSSRVEVSTISTLEADTTTLYPNIGEHIPSDAHVMSLKKEYLGAQQVLSLWLMN